MKPVTVDTLARKNRAFNEPIYLLNMKKSESEYEKIFNVVGTSGKIYVVTIGENLNCTCPDCTIRNNLCKHIYFIMLRVMKVKDVTKRKINKETLLTYFDKMPKFLSDDLKYDKQTKHNYNIHIKEEVTQKLDDICPICLTDICDEPLSSLCYCKYGCGKSVHKECFDVWTKSGINSGVCIFCRAKWAN